jgi:hypothetical protein
MVLQNPESRDSEGCPFCELGHRELGGSVRGASKPKSRDREIARAVHFANSGIANWEAEFFVLQNLES